jgi:hypothetical protein
MLLERARVNWVKSTLTNVTAPVTPNRNTTPAA